jgi:hypothetical protein
MKAANEKHFPTAMSLIDLLLAHNDVKSSPDVSSGLLALKSVVSDAWEVVDGNHI